jgi:hypothetical protein
LVGAVKHLVFARVAGFDQAASVGGSGGDGQRLLDLFVPLLLGERCGGGKSENKGDEDELEHV